MTFTPTDAANYNPVTVTIIAPNPDANDNGILDCWETTRPSVPTRRPAASTTEPNRPGHTLISTNGNPPIRSLPENSVL